jgi:hypothetical protein
MDGKERSNVRWTVGKEVQCSGVDGWNWSIVAWVVGKELLWNRQLKRKKYSEMNGKYCEMSIGKEVLYSRVTGWKGRIAWWVVGKEAQYSGKDSKKGNLAKWIVVRQYSGKNADCEGSTTYVVQWMVGHSGREVLWDG